jgi:hypothetical protein
MTEKENTKERIFYTWIVEREHDFPLCENVPVLYDTYDGCIAAMISDIEWNWHETFGEKDWECTKKWLHTSFEESSSVFIDELDSTYHLLECTYQEISDMEISDTEISDTEVKK